MVDISQFTDIREGHQSPLFRGIPKCTDLLSDQIVNKFPLTDVDPGFTLGQKRDSICPPWPLCTGIVRKCCLSVSNGHCIIEDMNQLAKTAERPGTVGSYLTQLRDLPFVRAAKLVEPDPPGGFLDFDAVVQVETPTGVWEYVIEMKRSYLDVAVTRAIAVVAKELARQDRKMLLFARYIPRPTARRLMEAGVEFVDMAGNIHLVMEPHYHWTVLGNREQGVVGRTAIQTPSTLMMLFAVAATPGSASWTVRELAAHAGVSKSKAAAARRDFVRRGTVREIRGRFLINDRQSFTDQVLYGYRQILRPRLTIGRFRSQERVPEEFVARLRQQTNHMRLRYALSGGIAAHQLQGFYKGPTVAAFVEPSTVSLARALRLLPDSEGPITLLRAFGEAVFWDSVDRLSLTHPWLIYAELMSEPDPRAHEAAETLRKEFLAP